MLRKYTQYEPAKTTVTVKGSSNAALLKKLFNAPVELTDEEKIYGIANKYLLAEGDAKGLQAGDPSQFGSGVNLNYSNVPDITKVTVGGGGLPSTPYTPNLTSPGEKNGVNPSGQVDMKVENVTELNGNAKETDGGLVNPKTTTDAMASATKFEKDKNPWLPGKHPGTAVSAT